MEKWEIENEIATELSMSDERLSRLEDTATVEEELKYARPKEEVKFNIFSTPKEIYFSYLRDRLSNGDAWSNSSAYQIDKEIVKELYKSGLDYMEIIESMTYSPAFREANSGARWIIASRRVAGEINPLLTLPDIKYAKPIRQYALTDFVNENAKDIYYSYLKAVLENTPDMKVPEADTKIIQLLAQMKIDEKMTQEIISHSPQFLSMNVSEGLLFNNEKAIAVKKIIEEAKSRTIESQINKSLKQPDPIQKMQLQLEAMREDVKNKKMNLKEYWENVNGFLKEMMLQVNQAKIAVRVLDQWVDVLEKSSQTFQIEMDQQLRDMKYALREIQQENYEDKWDFIYSVATQATSFADKMLQEIKSRDNPLLKLPEIVAAKEFAETKNVDAAQTLYFSALKSVLKEQPKLDIEAANRSVVLLMLQRNINQRKIGECLCNAPNLKQETSAKKTIYIHKTLQDAKANQMTRRKL